MFEACYSTRTTHKALGLNWASRGKWNSREERAICTRRKSNEQTQQFDYEPCPKQSSWKPTSPLISYFTCRVHSEWSLKSSFEHGLEGRLKSIYNPLICYPEVCWPWYLRREHFKNVLACTGWAVHFVNCPHWWNLVLSIYALNPRSSPVIHIIKIDPTIVKL